MIRAKSTAFLILMGFAVILIINVIMPIKNESIAQKYKVRAPEFPANLTWLNSGKSFSLQELHGKVVLLDFWTYCCINCMHILPKLKTLEDKYGNALVVIGVHSAKFKDEGESENIRKAILRYEIAHPVVNDREFKVWQSFGVNAWPSMVLIDPEGYVIATQSGESAPDILDPLIAETIDEFEKSGKLNRKSLNLVAEKESMPSSILSFPGKVLVHQNGKKLFISDSNHNRILILNLSDGRIIDVIGNGNQGTADGSFEKSEFNHPQGMALNGDILYIADTENHMIRAADLKNRKVTAIAGTGMQAAYSGRGGNPLKTDLNSPWDLEFVRGNLYIAMAGPHQLWKFDFKNKVIDVYAGSGREDIIDGPLKKAALAQPSGLTTDGERLYFADSEVSAVRWADLNPEGSVGTIVDEGLFEFGDKDGYGGNVRLQHPLGVVYHDGYLYVADTYNNKIKKIDPEYRKSHTFAGTGDEGNMDGNLMQASFDEPAGISVAPDGKLYVADTNNNLIRIIDPKNGTVETLVIKGLEKLEFAHVADEDFSEILPTWIAGDSKGEIFVDVSLPDKYKLTEGVPISAEISFKDGGKLISNSLDFDKFPIKLPFETEAGVSEIKIELHFFYCSSGNEGLCFFENKKYAIPVKIKNTGDSVYRINIAVKEPI